MKIRWNDHELEPVQIYGSKAKPVARFSVNGFDVYVSNESDGCRAEVWHPSGSFRAASDTLYATPQQAVDALLKTLRDAIGRG